MFVVYPDVLSTMPVSQLWSGLFFFMLLCLGLDSEVNLWSKLCDGVIGGRGRGKGHILHKNVILICQHACLKQVWACHSGICEPVVALPSASLRQKRRNLCFRKKCCFTGVQVPYCAIRMYSKGLTTFFFET